MLARDAGRLIGMTIGLPKLDLEDSFRLLSAAGFAAVEIFLGQLGPGIVDVPLAEAHAVAAARAAEEAHLAVSTLNCITGPLDAYSSTSARRDAARAVAQALRLGAAMGAIRVLLWDGELDDPKLLPDAPAQLADCLHEAMAHCGTTHPPQIAVELHPNTFAFRHRLHELTAERLQAIGVGICLDFCHASVALGAQFIDQLSPQFLNAVTHLHYADTDGQSEQLHFPPGLGVLDLNAIIERLAGRGLPMAWDLFGWPSPRSAINAGMATYQAAVSTLQAPPRKRSRS